MGTNTNYHLGAYVQYKPKQVINDIEFFICEKCDKKSNDMFCKECGGKIISKSISRIETEDLYDFLDAHNIVDRVTETSHDSGWIFVINNFNGSDRVFSSYSNNDDAVIDLTSIDTNIYIENFKHNRKDFIEALEKENIEYYVKFGFLTWYN